MPYPNEHSCRLEDPKQFDKFNRVNCDQKHDGKCIDVIYGIKSGTSKIQALRYPKKSWDVDAARSHCKSRKGTFEAAGESKSKDNPMREDRVIDIKDGEFRIESDGDQKRIVGYPAVFNKLSEPMPTFFGPAFREKIRAVAFKKALEGDPDIRALFNHNPDLILGRTISGTLEVRERTRGLWSAITPPDTQTGRDVVKNIERGDITQMSFGFTIDKDEWFEDDEGNVTRTIVSVDRLFDISPVTFPAYADTEVAVRSMQTWIEGGKRSVPEFMKGIDIPIYSREERHRRVRDYWEKSRK